MKEHFISLSEDLQEEAIHFVTTLSALQTKKRSEKQYWDLVDEINWQASDDYEAVSSLDRSLAKLEEESIYNFQDFLAEKLSDLDGPMYHAIAARGLSGSADAFLYARCFVVAKGMEYYYHVLLHPQDFPDEWFEAILHTADRAYKEKIGLELERLPAFEYETGFNPKLWGEEYVAAKLAAYQA